MTKWAFTLAFFLLPCAELLAPATAAETAAVAQFRKDIEPILFEFCVGCHNSELKKGGITFDQPEAGTALLENRDLGWKMLKMLRAGMMPPKNKARPSAEQIAQIETWIKSSVFKIDPKNPDPGRVTVRRLNRIEYRNTIRDLMGVNYDTDVEFPPDDTGHGFDNIGEVLSLSPLLLEKYITAARSIVSQSVPPSSTVVAEKRIAGGRFHPADASASAAGSEAPLSLSYYKPAVVSTAFRAEHPGRYQILLDLAGSERFVDGMFDYNKCRLLFKVDGKSLLDQEYSRQGGKKFHYEYEQEWKSGEHELAFDLQPLTPDEKQVRSLALRLVAVTVRGPLEKEYWVPPPGYQCYFPKPPPQNPAERRQYARELLTNFALKAFRRPADKNTLDRLAELAERVYSRPGATFEAGIAQTMTVVLASPKFLFREEGITPSPPNAHPFIDEYALAARLSYFLWSTMPDAELFRLAEAGELRKNLDKQLMRMLADARSSEFVHHFTGQWLQARDIETVPVNARAVMLREQVQDPKIEQQRTRFRELVRKPQGELTEAEKKELASLRTSFFGSFRRFSQFDLTGELRRAMRRETEMLFEHILRKDRSLLELLDCDYTFLNERLAKYYGIEGVQGEQMRLVTLPPDSPRGGILTQGTMLATTSNPDRTSPVKRGLYILDNILGTPPPPPPPDIPPLEEAAAKAGGRSLTLRETLQLHRGEVLCASCHNRMDPLGLALENFNALGRWRDKERNQPIDAAGELITGESFTSIRELKRILVTNHRRDFFRCVSEKMLTYALGRGLEYYDVQAVDELVERLEKEDGRPSALVRGITESVPFQRRRPAIASEKPATE